jgi:DnaJ-class molecular chaperone
MSNTCLLCSGTGRQTLWPGSQVCTNCSGSGVEPFHQKLERVINDEEKKKAPQEITIKILGNTLGVDRSNYRNEDY